MEQSIKCPAGVEVAMRSPADNSIEPGTLRQIAQPREPSNKSRPCGFNELPEVSGVDAVMVLAAAVSAWASNGLGRFGVDTAAEPGEADGFEVSGKEDGSGLSGSSSKTEA